MLDNHQSESELLEAIFDNVNRGNITQAQSLASKLDALRDLKFTLKKLVKEYDNNGIHTTKNVAE